MKIYFKKVVNGQNVDVAVNDEDQAKIENALIDKAVRVYDTINKKNDKLPSEVVAVIMEKVLSPFYFVMENFVINSVKSEQAKQRAKETENK